MSMFTRNDAIQLRNNCLTTKYDDKVKSMLLETPLLEGIKNYFEYKIKQNPNQKKYEKELYVWYDPYARMDEGLKTKFLAALKERYLTAFPDCQVTVTEGGRDTYFMLELVMSAE